jgi:DNA-binding NtrC family response regulator
MAGVHHILLVDDEESVTFLLKTEFEEYPEFSVDTAQDGVEAMNLVRSSVYDAAILDITMPRVSGVEVLKFIKEHSPTTQAIMLTARSDVKNAIACTRIGAYDFLSKPYEFDEVLAVVRRALEHRHLLIEKETGEKGRPLQLIGDAPKFLETISNARRVAESDAFVLIYGESGTGKELFAQLLHRESPRRKEPFIAVNCAAMPDQLLESELFGHEKGAFTSAIKTKEGLVEIAHGGTLFLDEVGDISPLVQPKLLRFLETGEFRRVGGTSTRTVNVRVISATNKNLDDEVRGGRFRDDLLYRLNVVSLRLPPLRERMEDIPMLVEHFTQRKSKTKRFSQEALRRLQDYRWPGNVRELEHVVEGAIALSGSDTITDSDLWVNAGLQHGIPGRPAGVTDDVESVGSLEDFERDHIRRALEMHEWNRSRTAKTLGITPKTLYLKIKKYGLSDPDRK